MITESEQKIKYMCSRCKKEFDYTFSAGEDVPETINNAVCAKCIVEEWLENISTPYLPCPRLTEEENNKVFDEALRLFIKGETQMHQPYIPLYMTEPIVTGYYTRRGFWEKVKGWFGQSTYQKKLRVYAKSKGKSSEV